MTKTKTIPTLYIALEPILKPGQPVVAVNYATGKPREGFALHATKPGCTEGDWWVMFGQRAEAVAQPAEKEINESK